MEKNAATQRQYGVKISPKMVIGMFALFFVLLIGVGVLTKVLPQGAYDRTIVDGQETIVNGTYKLIENPTVLPVWKWFTAPVEVLFSSDGPLVIFVIFLSVMVGGIYYVLDKADVLKRLIAWIYRKFGKQKYFILFFMTSLFLIVGSTVGFGETIIGIIPLVILMSISFGWDSLVGVALCYLATTRGYAASTFNPYGTAMVQSIAGVPLYSGLWLRFLYFAVTAAALVIFVYLYAKRIEKDPMKSYTYETDQKWRDQYTGQALFSYEKRKYPFKEFIKDFFKGALNILPTGLIACLILGMQYLIKEGNILDTIIHGLAQLTANASPFGAALIMCAFVLIVEVALPGTMVKALTILPILVPIGEFSGISRQSTSFIFAIGDAFPNMIYPTDSLLIFTLAILGCRYKAWIKWLWKYVLVCAALSVALIGLAIAVGF
ncbi:MAG: hypothetical protein ABFC73_02065 [Clostridiaceae bacterium]